MAEIVLPNFNTEKDVYFINGFHKISKGKILGFRAESIVLNEKSEILKIGNGFYQMKTSDGRIEETKLVFNTLKEVLKHICNTNIFSEIEKEFQPNFVFQNPELHNENTFNPIDSFDEYQKIAMSTKAYGKGLPVFYPALKLNGEAGEVAEKIGKIWRDKEGHISNNDKKEIEKELSDCLWYICAIADDLSINLVQVANTNIYKILDRRKRGVVSGSGDNR